MARVRKDRVQVDVEVNGKKVVNTLADMRKRYRQLNKEIANLEVGSEAFNKKAAEISKIKTQLAGASAATKAFQKHTVGLALVFKKLGQVIKTALGPLFALSLVGELINLTRQAGATAEAFNKSREAIKRFADVGEAELSRLNAQAQAISKTFDQDINEVIKTGNAVAKGFGVSMGEAFNTIETSLLAVGDKLAPEVLDQLREYSVQGKDLGLTFEEFAGIVAKTQLSGVFNDKGIDSLKEFNFRINDLTKGQREVLNQNFGEKYVAQIEKAGSTREKLELVTKGLSDLEAQGKETQVIVSDIFGGAGEDAGLDFLLSLQDIDGALEGIIDTSNVYIQRKAEQLRLEKELAVETEKLAVLTDGVSSSFKRFGLTIATNVLKAINGVIDFFTFFPLHVRVATSSFPQFINTLIGGFEKILRSSFPVLQLLERITGKAIELPKITLGEESLANLKAAEKALEDARTKRAQDRAAAQKLTNQDVTQTIIKQDKKLEGEVKKSRKRLIDIELDYLKQRKQLHENFGLEIEGINERIAESTAKLTQPVSAEKPGEEGETTFEKLKRQAETYLPLVNNIFSAQQNLIRSQLENEFQALDLQEKRALENAGDNANKRELIQRKFDKLRDEAERKQAKKSQDIAIGQAIIQGALNVIKSIGLGPLVIAATVAANAIQIAAIKSQKFADGGILPGASGIPAGSSHARGGISLIDNSTGQYRGEIEGGEPIISRADYAANRSLIDSIIFGKRSQGYYRDGGRLPAATQPSDAAVTAAANAFNADMLNEMRALRQDLRDKRLVLVIGEEEVDAISSIQGDLVRRRAGTSAG